MRPLIYLMFFLLSLAHLSYSQYTNIRFEQVKADQEIASNVTCILQDSRGFLWFGTRDGLNKYDGYELKIYTHDQEDSSSIAHSMVMDLAEDKEGNLWIATWGGGLSKYDRNKDVFHNYPLKVPGSSNYVELIRRISLDDDKIWVASRMHGLFLFDIKTEQFRHFAHDPSDKSSLSSDFVTEVLLDSDQNLWVGTYDSGLSLYKPSTDSFQHFTHDKNDENTLSHNLVSALFEDSKGRVWVGTEGGGLSLYNKQSQNFRHFRYAYNSSNSISSDVVLCMEEDEDGLLWIGTENGGVSILNPQTEKFINYVEDGRANSSVENNSIYDIHSDDKGNIWIGTFSKGLYIVNVDYKQFTHYKRNVSSSSLSNNNVLCIYEDSKENLWVGTDGGGLNLFDRQTGNFRHFKHEAGNYNSIAGNHVLKVQEDHKGELWIGTWGSGVSVYNPLTNTFRHFKHSEEDSTTISSNNVWSVYEDAKHNIWLATYSEGLNLYNREYDTFTHFKHNKADTSTISSNTVNAVYEDSKGNLWVGTRGGGLNLMNTTNHKFTRYTHLEKTNSISNNNTSCIYEDSRGLLWIGTEEGLNCFNTDTKEFTNIYQKDGLPHNFIYGILEDEHANLWISTKKGLCRYNPQKHTFKNYTVADGLQADEFREAYYKSRSGMMYFGGINGFNEFHPDSIQEKVYTPPLVITRFKVFNKEVEIAANEEEDAILYKHISETNEIQLGYEHSVFTIDYASLNYTLPVKKQYAYQLQGFDADWNYVGTKHSSTYTNLDPGTYIFKVKGLDNQGNWSEQSASLKISIAPPFWQTWWFKVALSILIVGGFMSCFHIRMRVIHKQKLILEKQVKKRTKQLEKLTTNERKARLEAEKAKVEAQKANRAKSVFLATMSHEIRTPMNGVMGMASLLEETPLTQEQMEYAAMIRSSSETLLAVINDILDLSKIESGRMELDAHDFNLRNCLEEVMELFPVKVAENDLDLILQIDSKIPALVNGDALRLRHILINLVGNAIKFTDKGEVFVDVRLLHAHEEHLELEFEVRDSGIGIPQDKIEKLFKAFYQADSSTTRRYGGSGLGLVICKNLVNLMDGDIGVKSKEGEGSAFIFNIKLKKGQSANENLKTREGERMQGKRVLIADDNTSTRQVLMEQLKEWKMLPATVSSVEQLMTVISNEEEYDMLLLDAGMAGMVKMEVIEFLKDYADRVPIVLMDVAGDKLSYDKSYASVVYKPIRQQTLYEHIISVFQAEKLPERKTKSQSGSLGQQYPLHILVAEDNLINQRLAIRILEKLGYHPDLVENGAEAVEKAAQQEYDIIFMDVQMPQMDGLEATREIRKRLNHQPIIIALTANAMQEDKEACLNAQMNDYLQKPFKLDELVNMLKLWASKIKNEQNS
ncbi:two-component regulator propeller domain-containing protein [Porifericola rhodea]|uniref:hybrid sensor histidine kinase/response regulator n=1 Tax=Porifericola rhodea TaxID=930972 RepID=UPI00266589ED|nr:hybrid sensor histidine kinase/response regulator [Porifericola rhodea]WKN33561.1 two-component regulator propeller domain-containing protein [Porifericola rhodea]